MEGKLRNKISIQDCSSCHEWWFITPRDIADSAMGYRQCRSCGAYFRFDRALKLRRLSFKEEKRMPWEAMTYSSKLYYASRRKRATKKLKMEALMMLGFPKEQIVQVEDGAILPPKVEKMHEEISSRSGAIKR